MPQPNERAKSVYQVAFQSEIDITIQRLLKYFLLDKVRQFKSAYIVEFASFQFIFFEAALIFKKCLTIELHIKYIENCFERSTCSHHKKIEPCNIY